MPEDYEKKKNEWECLQITNDGRNVFNMRTGEEIKYKNEEKIAGVLPKSYQYPVFPGDVGEKSADWVIDSLISLNKIYPSKFFVLLFADAMFIANHEYDPERKMYERAIRNTFDQIIRLDQYWKETYNQDLRMLILSTGGVVNFKGYIDLFDLIEKFPEYTFMSFWGHAGVFLKDFHGYNYTATKEPIIKLGERKPKLRSDFSDKELRFLKLLENSNYFEKVVVVSDLIKESDTPSFEFLSYAPDIICTAEQGKHFIVPSGESRKLYRVLDYSKTIGYKVVNDWNMKIPLNHITDIFPSTILNVQEGPTALIIIEGAGSQQIPDRHGTIETTWGNLPYGADHNFLFSVSTGKSAFHSPFPYGTSPSATRSHYYPYSWGREPVMDGIGSLYLIKEKKIRSIAAGSRSMWPHMFLGGDICIEPWARNRTENGFTFVLNKTQIMQKQQ